MTDKPTTATPTEDEPQIRPFSEVLIQQARGRTHDDLSLGLHNLIAAVQETGKGGKLQLTIDVKPLKSDTNTLQVVATVASKVPQVEQPASIFFVDDAGNLTRNDPRQMTLPLRDAADRRTDQKEAQ